MAANTDTDYRARLLEAVHTIERLEAMVNDRAARDAGEPIAVVGLSCRMPGGGNDPDAFWRLLRDGVDATGEFPAGRADAAAWYDANPEAPGKAYTVRGGFLDQVDRFEPAVFGISPREAIGMDPQQRLTLEVAWEALEFAGYAPTGLADSPTGVYVGVSTTDYVRMRQADGATDDIDAYQLVGEPSFVAGRISYTLGLRGPSKVIDTTCASSLVAVHDACRALRAGDCDMALAGGVNLMLSPYGFVLMSKFRALSPEGRCRTFDADANGYARGEGAGMVVLKRQSDAQAAGDTVLAVIRGTAINHDGHSSGLTVPNPVAQQDVMQAALTESGIEPAHVDYVEAHGTGTALGDPIELRSVQHVFARHRPADSPLLIGSVKTNIGHLESAAGIAGLIKVILTLRAGQIPPHLHFHRPNPNVDWSRLRMSVPTAIRPWPAADHPKAAAISGFGVSGTNAHAVLTEAPRPAADPARQRPVNTLTLSARTEPALRELAGRYARRLREHESLGDIRLADACFTTHVGRAQAARGVVVAGDSTAHLADVLSVVADGGRHDDAVATVLAPHRHRRLAWLFTGQGAQYVGMAAGLRDEPAFAAAIDECAAIMDPALDRPLRTLLEWDGLAEDDDTLDQTRYTQPALFAVEYALAKTWLSWGVRPAALLGHSVGEIVAASVAGVLSLPDAAKLAVERGRLMYRLPRDGALAGVMATAVCDERRARAAIAGYPDTVSIAAVNGPSDTVISGRREDVEAIIEELARDGIKHRRLRVSHAFHSPLLRPMLAQFGELLAGLTYRAPRIPLVSNVSGRMWTDKDVGPEYWLRHTEQAVRFQDGIRTLHADGIRTFLEIGPQPVLLGLGARCVDDPDCAWVPSLRRGRDDRTVVALALGALHLRGQQVDWAAFHRIEDARRIPLPTTPWHGESYWFPRARARTKQVADGEPVAGLGRRLRTAQPTYEVELAELTPDTLAELAGTAAAHALGGGWAGPREITIDAPIPGEDAVQLTVTRAGHGTAIVDCWAIGVAEEACGAPWRRHARCVLNRGAHGTGDRPAEPEVRIAKSDPPTPWHHPDTLLSQVEWHPAKPVTSPQPIGDCLLIADQGGFAARLADQLRAQGANCMVAQAPAAGQVDDVITRWRTGSAQGTLIVCTGLDAPGPEDTDPDALRAVRDNAELLSIAMLATLSRRPDCAGVTLSLLTRGAVATGAESPAARMRVAASALWGLGRVMALEHPEHWGGAIDLDPETDPDHHIEQLASALTGIAEEDQQALRGGDRLVARLVARTPEPGELTRRPAIRRDGSYLITGAFGGIGSTLARWLAEQGAGRLVLVARSPRPGPMTDELAKLGARVEVVAADVTDPDALRSVVDIANTDSHPLRGVAHAAGTSLPQLLREVTAEDYDQVWRPKVLGGWNLHSATVSAGSAVELDFFLSFSSISSVWGSQHLASYSAANAFLDGLAFHRRSLRLPALTVNWGPWDLPSNLFGADVMEFLRATGLKPLAASQCLKLLGALLAGEHAQQVVCAADWAKYKAVMQARADRPMLALIDTGEAERSGSADRADPGTLTELRAAAGGERLGVIDRWLRRQLAQILQLPVADLAGEFHLLEMGLDSLMVMELIGRCRGDLGVEFTSKDFFACDANLWAEFLLCRLTEQPEPA